LIPTQIDNLPAAGGFFSSFLIANDLLARVQCCIAMGQAAGAVADLAVKIMYLSDGLTVIVCKTV
jgi:hypothetical protein